jgi:hypothetical protein
MPPDGAGHETWVQGSGFRAQANVHELFAFPEPFSAESVSAVCAEERQEGSIFCVRPVPGAFCPGACSGHGCRPGVCRLPARATGVLHTAASGGTESASKLAHSKREAFADSCRRPALYPGNGGITACVFGWRRGGAPRGGRKRCRLGIAHGVGTSAGDSCAASSRRYGRPQALAAGTSGCLWALSVGARARPVGKRQELAAHSCDPSSAFTRTPRSPTEYRACRQSRCVGPANRQYSATKRVGTTL